MQNAPRWSNNKGSVLIIYSAKELIEGGSDILDTIESYVEKGWVKGDVHVLNLDSIPKGVSVEKFMDAKFGEVKISNIVLARH